MPLISDDRFIKMRVNYPRAPLKLSIFRKNGQKWETQNPFVDSDSDDLCPHLEFLRPGRAARLRAVKHFKNPQL